MYFQIKINLFYSRNCLTKYHSSSDFEPNIFSANFLILTFKGNLTRAGSTKPLELRSRGFVEPALVKLPESKYSKTSIKNIRLNPSSYGITYDNSC